MMNTMGCYTKGLKVEGKEPIVLLWVREDVLQSMCCASETELKMMSNSSVS